MIIAKNVLRNSVLVNKSFNISPMLFFLLLPKEKNTEHAVSKYTLHIVIIPIQYINASSSNIDNTKGCPMKITLLYEPPLMNKPQFCKSNFKHFATQKNTNDKTHDISNVEMHTAIRLSIISVVYGLCNNTNILHGTATLVSTMDKALAVSVVRYSLLYKITPININKISVTNCSTTGTTIKSPDFQIYSYSTQMI